MGDPTPPEDESSLFFLSTQIQSRYEDQEHQDSKISSLQKFKNALQPARAVQERVVQRRKKAKAKPKTRKITSISGFVRETLGSKKLTDTQSVLDYFAGDNDQMEHFLSKMESVTSTQHLLSSKTNTSRLFSEHDWKSFVEKLSQRFPGLSKRNRKSLKLISLRLERLKSQQMEEGGSQSIWSQASRQPSDALSADDMKLLYDLEDEQSEGSFLEEEPDPATPSCFTLSQVLDGQDFKDTKATDSQNELDELRESENETSYSSDNGIALHQQPGQVEDVIYVSDSEPDIEPLSSHTLALLGGGIEATEHLDGSNVGPSKHTTQEKSGDTSSHQRQVPESIDVLTSIAFAPSIDRSTTKGQNQNVPSTPTKKESQFKSSTSFKTPTKEVVRIESSPLSGRKQAQSERQRFQTEAESNGPTNSESLNVSPLKPRAKRAKKETLVCHGRLSLVHVPGSDLVLSSKYLPTDKDQIPDSEDDEGMTTVEIARTGEVSGPGYGSSSPNMRNVLQVPSSPEYFLQPTEDE